MHRRASPFVLALLLLGGCSEGSTPSSPSPSPQTSAAASPIGTWVGAFNDPIAGEGTARISFAERPPSTGGPVPTPQGALVGTWSVAFRSGETLSGQSYGEPVSAGGYGFFLYPDAVPPCLVGPGPSTGLVQYVLVGAAVTPTRLTATLGRGMCTGVTFGSVSLVRQ
ncbi:MAG: hypothetical protein ABL961_15715 [Vicinamibacterales bacterium]